MKCGQPTLSINTNDMTEENLLLKAPVTETEIKKCIADLKNNKPGGIDHVVNEYIKGTCYILFPLYVIMFKKKLYTAILPEEWLIGCIVPVYNGKKDVRDVNSYRGIVLRCFGKLFASFLNSRLTQYCNGINMISETEAGFRKGYATIDHIFVLKGIIDLYIWKRKNLFCLSVDHSKTFDMVWIVGLWYKRIRHEIKEKYV